MPLKIVFSACTHSLPVSVKQEEPEQVGVPVVVDGFVQVASEVWISELQLKQEYLTVSWLVEIEELPALSLQKLPRQLQVRYITPFTSFSEQPTVALASLLHPRNVAWDAGGINTFNRSCLRNNWTFGRYFYALLYKQTINLQVFCLKSQCPLLLSAIAWMLSHASAAAQDTVVKAAAAFYRKSLKSAPSHKPQPFSLNHWNWYASLRWWPKKTVNFHHNWWDRGHPMH